MWYLSESKSMVSVGTSSGSIKEPNGSRPWFRKICMRQPKKENTNSEVGYRYITTTIVTIIIWTKYVLSLFFLLKQEWKKNKIMFGDQI